MNGGVRDPGGWIQRSQRELERATRRVNEDDLEDAVFHLQQAAELGMKGVLIAYGWELQKTHKVPVLIDHLAKYQIDCESYRAAGEVLSEQYLAGRYPDALTTAPSPEEVRQVLKATAQLVNFMQGQVEARTSGRSGPARFVLDQT